MSLCPFCHNRELQASSRPPKKYDNTKIKKPSSHKLPLHEVMRRQDYERVYGKNAWTHFIKGRKWDKI